MADMAPNTYSAIPKGLTRRGVLLAASFGGATVLTATTASSVAAGGFGDTEILELLREYEGLVKAAEQHVVQTASEDEEMEALYYSRIDEIESIVADLPTTSAADFAAKVIVATRLGSVFPDWTMDSLWCEARALTNYDA